MELTFVAGIGIVATMLSIYNIIVSRKDKAVRDTKEDNYGLLNYKIDELKNEFSKFADKFDKYEAEIDSRIERAVSLHVKMYHSDKDK